MWGGGTEYLLCEEPGETSLPPAGRSLAVSVCLCARVSSSVNSKVLLWSQIEMIWLKAQMEMKVEIGNGV